MLSPLILRKITQQLNKHRINRAIVSLTAPVKDIIDPKIFIKSPSDIYDRNVIVGKLTLVDSEVSEDEVKNMFFAQTYTYMRENREFMLCYNRLKDIPYFISFMRKN
jgi:hypothetical protein